MNGDDSREFSEYILLRMFDLPGDSLAPFLLWFTTSYV